MKLVPRRFGVISRSGAFADQVRSAWEAVPKPMRDRIVWIEPRDGEPGPAPEDVVVIADVADQCAGGFEPMPRSQRQARYRYLLLGEDSIPDVVARAVMQLGVRTMDRLIIADVDSQADAKSVLFRLLASIGAEDADERIISATISGDTLFVRSASFDALAVPINVLASTVGGSAGDWHKFEIDQHGAFLYWPSMDAHLGWSHLKSAINPVAAVRGRQRSQQFNRQYGAAIRDLRHEHGLAQASVDGLSARTLRRIECGASRATKRSLEQLAAAHRMPLSDYLGHLAKRSVEQR